MHRPAKTAGPSGLIAQRHAYTLLELVIVLSVIGLLASLSWPMLMRPWTKSRVQQAAQDLSRELQRTRLGAIQTGQVYQFRWRPGTGQFEILPWDPPAAERLLLSTDSGAWDPGAAADTSISETNNESGWVPDERSPSGADDRRSQDGSSEVPPQVLPDGITFLDPDRPLDSAADRFSDPPTTELVEEPKSPSDRLGVDDTAADSPTPSGLTTTNWAAPVWFYPDGRATNARWVLVGEDRYQIEVILRGWVGTVQVGPVQQLEIPDAQTADWQSDTLPADQHERTPRS